MKEKIFKIFICIVLTLIFVSIINIKLELKNMSKEISALKTDEKLMLYQIEDNEKGISELDRLINKYSKEYGVDRNLVKAIAKVESGGNQNARSNAGAVGAMQVLPSTAKAMGENPYTLEGNIKAGTKYLAYLQKKYKGNQELTIAGYNAGEGNIAKYKGIPPFKETKHYIQKVKKEKYKLDIDKK